MLPNASWAEETNECVASLIKTGKAQAAAVLACRALGVAPHSYDLWSNLGAALWAMRSYDQALDALERALTYAPNHPLVLGNLALVYEGMGDVPRAEKYFELALANTPEVHSVRWNRALMRLRRGDYERGFAEYDSRIDNGHYHYSKLAASRWQGELGKTIYVEIEQGVGDVIMFSRFLPWLAERSECVYLRACPLTRPLLAAMPVTMVDEVPQTDYATYLGCLPQWYGLDADNIPPDPGFIRRAVEASPELDIPQPGAPGVKVGIAWSGNPNGELNEERSVPFRSMMTFGQSPRVWLYSLQVGDAAREVETYGAHNFVHDMSGVLLEGGFLATGRAILNCDLVITCCTSIAHLAGALSVPCWVMLSREPYWPWLIGESARSAWYPSVRLFRQSTIGDWAPVIAAVQEELAKL